MSHRIAAGALLVWPALLAFAGCGPAPAPTAPLQPVIAPVAGPVPTTTTAGPPRSPPPATAAAPITSGAGEGKGPPRSPSGTSGDDGDDGEREIQEVGPMSDTQRAVFRVAARCYEKGLQRGEKPGTGSLMIELAIDEAGKVTSVDLGPGHPASVKACIAPKLRAIAFPPQAGSGLRVVRYPMNEVSLGEAEADP